MRALASFAPTLLVAEVLEAAGDAARALEVLARLRREGAPAGPVRLAAGRCQLALGAPRKALRHLIRAVEAPAVRIEATEALAQVYLRQGAHREAAERSPRAA